MIIIIGLLGFAIGLTAGVILTCWQLDDQLAELLAGGGRMSTISRYKMVPLLTPAEENIVRCLLAGHTSSEALARELCITKSTVRAHLVKISSKIGANDRTSVVLWAIRNGYEVSDE